MNALLRTYQNIVMRFPIGSQAIQTGILMGAGDVLCQTVVEKRPFRQIDFARTAHFSLIGAVVVGPPLRIWYGVLEKRFGYKGKIAALKKLACDQILFAPIFLAVVMVVIGLTQGKTLNEVETQLKRDYTDILLNNYKIWPAVQLCNFYFVPLHYQVIVVQVVAVFWNTYFSWKMNVKNRQTTVQSSRFM